AAGVPAFLHPLVHRNTSTFFAQRFSSTFSGEEFFLADHVINGQRFLPGVAYLEMASAALALAGGEEPSAASPPLLRLTDVVWLRPVIVGAEPVEGHIRLLPDTHGLATFEVYSEIDGETLGYSQGTIGRLAEHEMERASPYADTGAPAAARLDLPALQAQCDRGRLSGAQCYQAFRAMHMTYGPGHQGIDALYLGAQDGTVQILARLTLPEH